MSERRTSGRATPRVLLPRLLLVLAAVLGVVGMHAVGTGHSAVAVAEVADHGTAAPAMASAGAGHGVDAAGLPDGASDAGHADALAHLCLAVVGLGVAALAVPLAVRRARRAGDVRRPVRRATPRPVVASRWAPVPPWTHLTRAELCLWRV